MWTRPAKQALIGLLAMPLSMLPFVAYAELTPQGSLLAAKVHVALAPPGLPEFDAAATAAMQARAPRWSGVAAVLVYHGLGATTATAEQRWTITPKRFAEQIATLKASGMNPVTAAEFAAARSNGSGLPDNAVLVTFDDGRTDALLWADPILEAADWQATMFVITSEAAETSLYYASWGELAKLADTGRWDIESHSADMHFEQEVDGQMLPALTSLSVDESLEAYRYRVTQDLETSIATITDEVGTAPRAFAYPFGAYGADRENDPRLQATLADAVATHMTIAFQQDDQDTVPLAGCSGDPLLIRRLEVGDWSGTQLIDRLVKMAAERRSVQATRC